MQVVGPAYHRARPRAARIEQHVGREALRQRRRARQVQVLDHQTLDAEVIGPDRGEERLGDRLLRQRQAVDLDGAEVLAVAEDRERRAGRLDLGDARAADANVLEAHFGQAAEEPQIGRADLHRAAERFRGELLVIGRADRHDVRHADRDHEHGDQRHDDGLAQLERFAGRACCGHCRRTRLFRRLLLVLRLGPAPVEVGLLAQHLVHVGILVADRDVLVLRRAPAFLRHGGRGGDLRLAADLVGLALAALLLLGGAALFFLAPPARVFGEPPLFFLGALARLFIVAPALGVLLFLRLALGRFARTHGRRDRPRPAVRLVPGLALFVFAVGEVIEIRQQRIGEALGLGGRLGRRHHIGARHRGRRRSGHLRERLLFGAALCLLLFLLSPVALCLLALRAFLLGALALGLQALPLGLERATRPLGFFRRLALGLFARLALGFQALAQLLGLAPGFLLGFLARAFRFLARPLLGFLARLALRFELPLGLFARLALGFDPDLRFRLGLRLGFAGRTHGGLARRLDLRLGGDLRLGFVGLDPGLPLGARLGLHLDARLRFRVFLQALAVGGGLGFRLLTRLGKRGSLLHWRGRRLCRRTRRARLAERAEIEITAAILAGRTGGRLVGGRRARARRHGAACRRSAGRHFADEAVLVELRDQALEAGVERLADFLRDFAERCAPIDSGKHDPVSPLQQARLAGCLLHSLTRLRIDGGRIHFLA